MIRNPSLSPSAWISPRHLLAWPFLILQVLVWTSLAQRSLPWTSKHKAGLPHGSVLALSSSLHSSYMYSTVCSRVCVSEVVLSPKLDYKLGKAMDFLPMHSFLQVPHLAPCLTYSRYLASICPNDKWITDNCSIFLFTRAQESIFMFSDLT